MRRLRQLLVLPTIALAFPAAAEVYRWTNDAGETHFGANPPAGVNAEPVSTGQTNTIDTSSRKGEEENGETDGQQQESAGDQGEGNGGQSPDKQKREQIRKQNCEAARQALKTLEQNARVQVMEDGERRYLSPEEKAAERERYEKIRDENCD